MKKIFLLGILTTVYAFPQSNIGTAEFETSRYGHSVKLVFTIGDFDPSAHKIVGLNPCKNSTAVRIDNKYPLGTDCTLPTREIKKMSIIFDGINIEVLRYLFSDCYQPPPFNLKNGNISKYLAMRIGDDLQSLFVFMEGGDAAGCYEVLWIIRTDNKHSRLSGFCSDQQLFNLDSGFFKLQQSR